MLVNNSLVLYKNAAAAITGECVSGKFPVRFRTAPACGLMIRFMVGYGRR